MAFGVGAPGSDEDQVLSDINVTPLVDVMLVLLIIFMITAPMLQQGVQVTLPRAEAENLPTKTENPLILAINRDGLVYIGKEPIHPSQLTERLLPMLQARGDDTVFIKGDTRVEYGRVIEVLDLLHQAGVTKIGMVTEKPDRPRLRGRLSGVPRPIMPDEVQTILERRSTRPVRRQQTTAVATAVAFHALLVSAAFALPRLSEHETKYPEYVEVHVVPARALGVERPKPRPAKPKPAPETPPPPPEPKPEPEVPALPEKPAPKKSVEKPAPTPAPEPAPRPADRASQEGPEGAPHGATTGDSRLGAQVVGPEGTAFPYDYYLDQMLGQIRQNWTRPPAEGIEALISFRVLRDGQITEVEVRQSSGSRSFDLAALRAVHNASPLPPLPTSYGEDVLSVNLIVR